VRGTDIESRSFTQMQLLRTPSWSFSYATQKELEILRRNLLQSFIKTALKPVRPCATAELISELRGMELYLLELPSSQSAKRRDNEPKAKSGRRRRRANASGRPRNSPLGQLFPDRMGMPGTFQVGIYSFTKVFKSARVLNCSMNL
jgi:hypothetical protein